MEHVGKYDPEYQRNYQREKYHRWMMEAREQLGGQCIICGRTEDLEFDHIDPATKLFTLGQRRVRREVFDAEVMKCQLLCIEHHREKTAREQRKDVHGTWGMYRNRKCRCRECRDFVNSYMREYKRRNRLAPGRISQPRERSSTLRGGTEGAGCPLMSRMPWQPTARGAGHIPASPARPGVQAGSCAARTGRGSSGRAGGG